MADKVVEVNNQLVPAMVVLPVKDFGDKLGNYQHCGQTTAVDTDDETAFIAYRNTSTDVTAKLVFGDFFTNNEGVVKLQFYSNGIEVTGGTWSETKPDSVIDYNDTLTSFTGGIKVHSKFITATSVQGNRASIGDSVSNLEDLGFILPPGYTMVVTKRRDIGTTEYVVGYSFNWNEYKY